MGLSYSSRSLRRFEWSSLQSKNQRTRRGDRHVSSVLSLMIHCYEVIEVMKIRVYKTFKYQVPVVIMLWIIFPPLHLQLSGWGTTLYIPVNPEEMKTLPYYNWYNKATSDCTAMGQPTWFNISGLPWQPTCGSGLTNIMHGVANGMILLTIDLFFASFSPAGLFAALIATTWIENLWEVWEINVGITTCNPALFSSVQHCCQEAIHTVIDQQFDVMFGFGFACLIMVALWLLDRHFGYEYIGR
jgi:hypothetical protein